MIATAVGGIPEQIVHLESGILVPSEDPSAIATWIVRLQDDPALRMRLAASGQERAKAAFPLQAQARGLDRAYAEAIARRTLPAPPETPNLRQ